MLYTQVGETFEACIKKIEEKHGKNYTLVVTKNSFVAGGFFGLKKKPVTEVSYQVRADRQSYWPQDTSYRYSGEEVLSTLPSQKGKGTKSLQGSTPKPTSNPSIGLAKGDLSGKELEVQKQKILEQAGVDTNLIVLKEMQKLASSFEDIRLHGTKGGAEHQNIKKIRDILIRNDFSYDYIQKTVSRIQEELTLSELDKYPELEATVYKWISEDILIREEGLSDVRPHIFLLVGPTGIGKTTTVAKIAARYKFSNDYARPLFVRMVTIDTYRIGATDQLKTYGKIMDIPVSVVDNADDMRKLLAMHEDTSDLILIDTIGKSPKDYAKLGEMKKIFSPLPSTTDVHLAVSATTKYSDLVEICNHFEPFGYTSVVIIKIDETSHVGNLISIFSERRKAISYICDGQVVPSDIKPASKGQLLAFLEGFSIKEGNER